MSLAVVGNYELLGTGGIQIQMRDPSPYSSANSTPDKSYIDRNLLPVDHYWQQTQVISQPVFTAGTSSTWTSDLSLARALQALVIQNHIMFVKDKCIIF